MRLLAFLAWGWIAAAPSLVSAATALLFEAGAVAPGTVDALIPLPNGHVVSSASLAFGVLRIGAGDRDVLVHVPATGATLRYGDFALLPLDTLATSFAEALLAYDAEARALVPYAGGAGLRAALDAGTLVAFDPSRSVVPRGLLALDDPDGDGITGDVDGCPDDGDKSVPGICGCGTVDGDADGDTTVSCLDCNDHDAGVHPGAAELCNGVDDDCNDLVDNRDPALAPCDDHDACTGPDTCEVGRCIGPALDGECPASDQCHDPGACDPRTGACVSPARQDDSPCDDGDPCTESDVCRSAVCTSGAPKLCGDGDPCTTNERCEAGACASDPVRCPVGMRCDSALGCVDVSCDDGDACTVDGSDVSTGECLHVARAGCCRGDAACADGDACTQHERCEEGRCASDPVACAPSTACIESLCDPQQGCVAVPRRDGTTCDAGDPCTGPGACAGGACMRVPIRDAGPLDCELARIGASLCAPDAVGSKLGKMLTKRITAARTLARRAAGPPPARRARRLLRKIARHLEALTAAVERAAKHGDIGERCRATLADALSERRAAVGTVLADLVGRR